MNTFTYQNLTFEYEITGEGLPFVFLHGLGGGIHQIKGTYLPVEGVQLINMNQQGHGHSQMDPDTLDFDRMAEDTLALLDHLGIRKAVFGGISMGAAIALNLALRFPHRVMGLVLIRNAWLNGPMDADRVLAYHDLGCCLKKGGLAAFRKTGGWDIVKAPSAYTANAFTLPFSEDFNIKNWQKYRILPCKAPFTDPEDLKKLTMPVHILACRSDFCHPYGYGVWLHEHIPGSTFTEIPDKDTDGAAHKAQINAILKQVLTACK